MLLSLLHSISNTIKLIMRQSYSIGAMNNPAGVISETFRNSNAKIKYRMKNMFAKRIISETTDLIVEHPRLFTITVGFAITLAVGTAIGTVQQQAHAMNIIGMNI